MTLRSRCTRIATIALAAAALAAPAASARPVDVPPAHAGTSIPAQTQDLRSADAIDAATRAAPHRQDLRSADAIDAAAQAALDSRADTTAKASAGRGVAWPTIAIGLAGSLLALGIVALATSRTRRTARARVSA